MPFLSCNKVLFAILCSCNGLEKFWSLKLSLSFVAIDRHCLAVNVNTNMSENTNTLFW